MNISLISQRQRFPGSSRHLAWLAVIAMLAAVSPIAAAEDGDARRLQAVTTFADQVLERGRDRWSGQDTPLFADGLDLRNGAPVVWKHRNREYIISNLASQQNLLRTLVALSRLGGEERYRTAAAATVRYHFDHLASPCGLLRWGGHQFIDLRTLSPVGNFDANSHEFKNSLPYYAFLYEVDAEATARLIRAVWDAHVTNWGRLDMNRHGGYRNERNVTPELWNRSFRSPEPFFEGNGLTFVNAGNDLIYAAGQLAALHGEAGALTWAHRLAQQYVRSRHPETGLGSYQYSKPRRRRDPVWPMTEDGHTWSHHGDRAENHFGREFGEVAREGWALFNGRERSIYAIHALVLIGVAEELGDQGQDFLTWTVDGLSAYLQHAYDEARNHFRPLWADGTDLSGRMIETFGYYNQTSQPRPFTGSDADGAFLVSYARAFRLSGDQRLWRGVRGMVRGNGLGELGAQPADQPRLNLTTDHADPETIYALLDLYRVHPHAELLNLARRIGDNILHHRIRDGFFVPSHRHYNATFNAQEPLALLALHATIIGQPEAVPPYVGSRGYIHGRFDGVGRTYDARIIYGQTEE